MTPPRKKFVNELTHDNNDNEYSKRIRLISTTNDHFFSNGLNHGNSQFFNQRATVTIPHGNYANQFVVNHSTLNSAFQPYFAYTTPNNTANWTNNNNQINTAYRIQDTADMYFFKNNENSSEFSNKKCRQFFKQYASVCDPETIDPDGIERLCTDLQVKPEDIVMLVLSWKLGAKVMGFFSWTEWNEGMSELKCDCIAKLRNKLSYLRSLLQETATFKSIYRYSFDFAKDCDQRCMDIDVAKQMLNVLLGQRWSVFPYFAEFLTCSKYKVINKDQYFNVLDFSRTVNHELTNYDENSAWPVMMDEFVDWCRKYKGFQNCTDPDEGLILVDD